MVSDHNPDIRPDAAHRAQRWQGLSVLLPVVTEVDSLRETIDRLERSVPNDVCEYLILVCERTTPESLAVCASYASRDPERFRVLAQRRPRLGGAMRDGFDWARGSHVLMMASDLETDPDVVPDLVACARLQPDAIVTASRWLEGGALEGYGGVRKAANFLFQTAFSLLYGASLTDMTYGFRIFPTSLVRSIAWEELGHPLLFETLVRPLRLGVRVHEVPARWRPRVEGASQAEALQALRYAHVGLRVRLRTRYLRRP